MSEMLLILTLPDRQRPHANPLNFLLSRLCPVHGMLF